MAEVEIHQIQAAAEGVEIVGDGDKVELLGEWFRIAEQIGQMPLLKFAASAEAGADSTDMAGYAAMYAMLRDCIDPAEWGRFERHAMDSKATGDDLFKVVTDTIQLLTARPTRRPSDSSAGPLPTSEPSKGISSSPVPQPRTAPADQDMSELVPVVDLLAERDRRLTA